MSTVELIYDADCPNAATARCQLLKAFARAGTTPRWTEWDRADPESPAYVNHYGSPTILVDGEDVAGEPASEGVSCCRLYASPSGAFQGAPSVQLIASALGSGGGDGNAGPGGAVPGG